MTRRTCVVIGLVMLLGCDKDAVNSPGGGDELTLPTGDPGFAPGSSDIEGSWMRLIDGRGFDYDVVFRRTDAGGDFLGSSDMIERRSYEGIQPFGGGEYLEVTGTRMGAPLSQRLQRSANGWIYLADGDDWIPIAPSQVEKDNRWTTRIHWFSAPGQSFEGEYQVWATDAVSNGVAGAVHIHSTFSQGSYTGTWDAYWVDGGPMIETRTIVEPTGVTLVHDATRRPSL